ncbi:MAG TPA: TonB-dependent receptor [Steroidobacteraceae bacterium]|jgi:outer membrane receptor protein involved in Fe transport|nr:TonB-dependent receptor [Steroidobacteraceae bacterium]
MPHSDAILQLRILICVAGSALPGVASASDATPPPPANPAAVQELPQVTVIANTPLSGLGLPLNQVPANVQTGDSQDMRRQLTLDLADYLNNNFSGVNVSESAANPFQLDINYHGFTASPLLGTPEGLSVYVDGVRVNESFGDTVNWDLIPQSAISTVTLMSGSNPVFGLNTLGGALSVRTKSGHDNPGTELEAYGGSFGRRSFEGETGGELGNFDYFLTASYFDDSGWRDFSPTRLWQAFGKVGWQNEHTDLDLSYTYADTSLYGNGAVPQSMLDFRRETSYTPDFTQNLLNFINLTGTQFVTQKLLLSGNVYYRRLVTDAINGNVNDSYLDDDYGGPPIDCSTPPANRAALTWCAPGQNATGRITQRTAGLALQLTDSHDLFGWPNQAILGADYNDSSDTFTESYQYGQLSADRMLIYQQSPFNNQTVISLTGDNRIYGVYATDTLSPNALLHLTFSIRYNRSTETLDGYSVDTDIGDFGSGFDEVRPLGGEHTFSRVNPAFGFTVTPRDTLTFYADYNEASRAPTVIELGCADPAVPCGLPNDFASDPALQQVVARTAEAGVRASLAEQQLVWSADAFRTLNSNDIQFVATATNSGYFANVGSTRRQGLDLALGGRQGHLHWQLMYSLVDATFESSFPVNAASNSTANADGDILVRPGDRMPLIPRHTGRLILDYQLGTRWNFGANLVAASGSFLHGNENNANQAGATNAAGAYITGSGSLPGYAVVNLHATFHINDHAEVFARLTNLFDRRYATAGFLTSSSFNPNGSFIPDPANWTNENALSPAQPLGIWAGLRMHLE